MTHAVVLLVGPRELVLAHAIRLVRAHRGRQRDAGLLVVGGAHAVDVVGRRGVADQHARLAQPIEGGPGLSVDGVGVGVRVPRQVDLRPRDVEKARGPAGRELAGLVGADDVVRRCGDLGRVVGARAQRGERFGEWFHLSRSRRRRYCTDCGPSASNATAETHANEHIQSAGLMTEAVSLEELRAMRGELLGVSEWLVIDQARIDGFADVTEDRQFVHVDAERAREETPFGGTIAHGLLSLSMIVRLCLDAVPEIEDRRLMLNYGFDKVRFPAPVKAGRRVRAHTRLAGVDERKPGQILLTLDVTIEIEGEERPAVVAEWLSLHLTGSK